MKNCRRNRQRFRLCGNDHRERPSFKALFHRFTVHCKGWSEIWSVVTGFETFTVFYGPLFLTWDRVTGSMVLFGTETNAMGLLSSYRSNAEYLDESCTEGSSREEFHGSRVRQIEVYDRTASHSDWTEIRTRTAYDRSVWTADVIPISAQCRLFFRIEVVVVDRSCIRPREPTAIT